MLHFIIKPKKHDLTISSHILVYFPAVYPINFEFADPYCLINEIYTRCEFTFIRLLKVKFSFLIILAFFLLNYYNIFL